jgi:hypothetical protein
MKISEEKKEKISEQILNFLFQTNPQPIFTSHIAKEIARDEEFTKSLLKELLKKNLVLEIKKNKDGVSYVLRSRWKLSPRAYDLFKKYQT